MVVRAKGQNYLFAACGDARAKVVGTPRAGERAAYDGFCEPRRRARLACVRDYKKKIFFIRF